MNGHLFDHLDLRVSNIAAARPLYDAFLPALGFTRMADDGPAFYYGVEGDKKSAPFIELNEQPGYRGSATRFAFWADTEEEVNRLGEIVRAAGAWAVEGPENCHEYTPGYYAVFFEDADGNKWEVCCRTAPVR